MTDAVDGQVSVIVPTRNRSQLIPRVIQSALHQEDVDLELVMVDDASTDRTGEYLSTARDARIVYCRNETRMGVAAARNRGIEASRGEWIAFLDDDDLWAPTKLRSQLQLCADLGAQFSYTSLVDVDSSLQPKSITRAPRAQRLEIDLLGHNVIGSPSSVIVRRHLLEQVGYFDPKLSVLADWDLWLRLAVAGRAAPCEEALTAYVLHPDSMHLDVGTALSEFHRLRKRHAGLAHGTHRRLGNEQWWEWVAWAYRRSGNVYRAATMFLWLGFRFSRPRDLARSVGILFGERAMACGRSLLGPKKRESSSRGAARARDRLGAEPRSDVAWVQAFRETV